MHHRRDGMANRRAGPGRRCPPRTRRTRVPSSQPPRRSLLTAALLSLTLLTTVLIGAPAAHAAPGGGLSAPAGGRRGAVLRAGLLQDRRLPARLHPGRHRRHPAARRRPTASPSTPPRTRAAFTDANLAKYAAVIWLSTTGDVLDADPAGRLRALHPGRRRLRRRPRRVRHRVRLGVVRRAGRRLLRQPPGQPAGDGQGGGPGAPVHGRPAGRAGRASTSGTTSRPTRAATCTCWPAWTRRSYTPGAGAMGADHPIAWCQDYDGGRAWYTGGGHTSESYAEPAVPARTCSAASRPPPARWTPTAAPR